MSTKERNMLLDILSLAKKVNMENGDIKYCVVDLLRQCRIGLETEKRDLEYRMNSIKNDLELIDYVKDELGIKDNLF